MKEKRVFRKLILPLIFSFSYSALAKSPGSYSQLKGELQKVSKSDIMSWVNELVKFSAPSRMVGEPGHEKAFIYIQDTIKKLDPKGTGKLEIVSAPVNVEDIQNFYQKDFNEKVEGKLPKNSPDYQKWLRFTRFMKHLVEARKTHPVQNIVWEKVGLKPEKVLVVSAHYDTISHDKKTLLVNEKESMPGANYNASGVSVLFGLIKVLSQMDLNYSVRIVFLDWQGIGFYGSEIYSRDLKNSGKDILGVMNLEMLGQDTIYFDKTKKSGNMSVYLRDDAKEIKWVNGLTERGSKVTDKVTFAVKPNGFESSDNFRFNQAGFLSATFSQNWEDDFNPKFYQTPQDTPETLNQETLWQSYQYVGGAVAGTLLDLTK